MFCPNCGANLPDDAGFCTGCGTRIAAAQPAYQQPVYQNGAAMSKGDYLKSQASPQTKLMVKIAWGLLALCVLIVGLGLNSCINGPFYNIPVVQLAMGDDYEEALEELTDILGEAGDEIDEFVEMYEDEVSPNELTKLAKAATKMAKNPSLNNVKKVGTLLYENDLGGMSRSDLEAYNLVLTLVWIAFGILLVLTVLGGTLRNIIPLIIAAVLSVPVNLIFSGVLYMLLTLAALIALMVVLCKINGAYKDYKRGMQPSYGY